MAHASTTPPGVDARRFGRWAAYAALALEIAGFAAISASDTYCTGNTGSLTEPGNTIAVMGFVLGPILAVAALVLLVRARSAGAPGSPLAIVVAIVALPFAAVEFFFWVAASALSCGFF